MATVACETSLEIQISADQKGLIEEAAALSGQSLAEFAASSTLDAARRVVDGHRGIRLCNEDRDLLLDLLENPPEPGPRLRRAAQQHKENIVS